MRACRVLLGLKADDPKPAGLYLLSKFKRVGVIPSRGRRYRPIESKRVEQANKNAGLSV